MGTWKLKVSSGTLKVYYPRKNKRNTFLRSLLMFLRRSEEKQYKWEWTYSCSNVNYWSFIKNCTRWLFENGTHRKRVTYKMVIAVLGGGERKN